MSTDAPKSSLELVMERLRQQDQAKGETQVSLTDAQREALADAKRLYDARVAERRIMHQATLATTFDPTAREERAQELRRDLDRFEREYEEKANGIRQGS